MDAFHRAKAADVLSKLESELQNQLTSSQTARVMDFAHIHYTSSSEEELAEKCLEELYGSTLECWHFLQQADSLDSKVKVFNPDFEKDGWQSTHTVVVILQEDMPFLIDSIKNEINRRDLTIHSINNSILAVKRDKEGHLLEFYSSENAPQDLRRESIIYIEVDRHTNGDHLADIADHINDILTDVRLVTSDFKAMSEQSLSMIEYVDSIEDKLSKVDLKELKELLEWLNRGHFTFLGYAEYKLSNKTKPPKLQVVVQKSLGLFKRSEEHNLRMNVTDSLTAKGKQIKIESLLGFSKSPSKSRIHRPAYSDYITIKRFDTDGRFVGEHRFLGLYTSAVYYQSIAMIPVIRHKADKVLRRSGLYRGSHDWKDLQQILEAYPRDELFQISSDELFETSLSILHIHERRQTRFFVRKDEFGRYYSCLVYVPRDIYNTDFRHHVERILKQEFNAEQLEFNTKFSESVLCRTQYIVHVDDEQIAKDLDTQAIEKQIVDATRSWTDEIYDALVDAHGEEQGIALAQRYKAAFPASYRDDFSYRTAVIDIQHLQTLTETTPLAMSFYRDLEQPVEQVNFKLFHYNEAIPLSDVIPIMENLGLKVMDEHPYAVKCVADKYWIHDFRMLNRGVEEINIPSIRDKFQKSFAHIWFGDAVSDQFNRLVLWAQLDWREVAVLRAYAAYIKQLKFGISQSAFANCLIQHVGITRKLVALFSARFDPLKCNADKEQALQESIIADLDNVPSLTDDRIIRRYLDLIGATLRTNFFQKGKGGVPKSYISFKFCPQNILDIPQPRPLFEIFVYSPRVQGIHLRGGKVARGGLRWSDRSEDFRTEVLGLVKAQQVKNAVIVPVGAKGGFVPKQLRDDMSREEFMAEGVDCYKLFIRGLLDITDNIVDGNVVPPKNVVRHDEDDPYLVVAADKGTATFSDIANGIAHEYGFWLGDAFASGGSQGYDHKGMGITAKGAWVSVERHFRELNHNTRTQDFTVIGIGDMSGDVFGNGMLLSHCIQLVAAFNHLHIFVDPNPDSGLSYQERRRLFELPRSSWQDYDKKLISRGGGVFARKAKSIPISPEMKSRFNIEVNNMTPSELLSAILKAPVDLLWNGGIGTYVKSSTETHADVGDKANDAIRINANELQCRVIGEGGNLGVTQLARLDYSLHGGACNSDFIDNAGGVDCSDHEVNVKILLDTIMAAGDLTQKQRNQLLKNMTDSVSELVLRNNYQQTQVISLMQAQTLDKMGEYRRLITSLEDSAKLDRELEFIPCDEELAERRGSGKGLTRAEIAVLVSYCKAQLKEQLVESELPDDGYACRELESAFPAQLVKLYPKEVYNHKLRREIISTQIANHLVNHMGIAYVYRLQQWMGCNLNDITKAYILARDVFQLEDIWQQIEALDNKIDASVQTQMMLESQRLVRRASRWFLRNRRMKLDIQHEVDTFGPAVQELREHMGGWLDGNIAQTWDDRYHFYTQSGVPKELASSMAATGNLYISLGAIEVAEELGIELRRVIDAYSILGERLDLYWFSSAITDLKVENQWQGLAREAYRDDLEWQGRALAKSLLNRRDGKEPMRECFDSWMAEYDLMVRRWLDMLSDLKSADVQDYSMYTVAIRELFDLAQGATLGDRNPVSS